MELLQRVYNLVWGLPALVLILSVGIYLTARTRFLQLRLLPRALRLFFSRFSGKCGERDATSFRALCTALAATVGTGNLAGVAGAIALGGPGSIFWMWICAFLGMIIKFSEATLALRFRARSVSGEYVGGPMYMITGGLASGFHPLAWIYACFGLIAAFGVGNATQINTVVYAAGSAVSAFGADFTVYHRLLLGIILAALVGPLLLGGAKRIGAAAELLVPFAAGIYLVLGLLVLLMRAYAIPEAFAAIFRGAFTPEAVTGGAVGSIWIALRTGVSRGVFTNEAGMGTASMAHACAKVSHPAEQGLMGIVEVFLDTIVICTVTALVILCSGVAIPYGTDPGVDLTSAAFSCVLGPWVSGIIAVCLCLFALATVLGWGLYGIRCAQFLFGHDAGRSFAWLQIATVLLSTVLRADAVWLLAEIVNGLMAIPNLISLLALTPELINLYKSYLNGGKYENLHQCQSL